MNFSLVLQLYAYMQALSEMAPKKMAVLVRDIYHFYINWLLVEKTVENFR